MRNAQDFLKPLSPVHGLPCWGVRPAYGSFLTLEFGNPRLEVREPFEARDLTSSRVRKHFARRHVSVRGEWRLWVYCCDWTVINSGKVIGDSSTSRRIGRAADELDGQRLSGVAFTHRGCRTTFEFDLGATLETKPYDRKSEQWLFVEPSGTVLTLRADKKYSYGNSSSDAEKWLPIKEA